MSQSLIALMTKLGWQNDELHAHLQNAEHDTQKLIRQITELDSQMNQSSSSSLTINPELEINRLNFITQQKEFKDNLLREYKDLQTLIDKLRDKIQRVKTELKMLEKYMEREKLAQKNQQQNIEETSLDEWGSQQGRGI